MNSLKSIIPLLSDVLVLSEHALYERQRALVRGGLLKAIEGRGPGSGVKATPENVAMLIISVLATDSLSDVIADTKVIVRAARQEQNADVLPELRTFKAAVAYCFTSDDYEIMSVKVFRDSRTATIEMRDGRNIGFGKPPYSSFIFITAMLPREAFYYVHRLLKLTDPPTESDRNPYLKMKGRPS